MAKEFITNSISDVDINQVIITKTSEGEVRVRANVSVSLANKLDPTETHAINIPINVTPQELGVGPQILAIRNAILTLARTKL